MQGGLGFLQIKGLKELHANRYGKLTQAADIISVFGKDQINIYICTKKLRKANLHVFPKI